MNESLKKPGGISIEVFQEDEWPVLKDLRIRALTDSPDSFGPTLEQALLEPDDTWQRWTEAADRTGHQAFFASQGDQPVGLVSARMDENRIGHIGAMWVDPMARGMGLGKRLMQTACDWLVARNCGLIKLWVTVTNEPAIRLYQRCGFVETGLSKPLRPGSHLRNMVMERRGILKRQTPSPHDPKIHGIQ